ncbi:MAG: metallophosphoesterase family protein [Acetobacteraceae bacterium]|nr:metallophosphoesterase family protein [Acetobacteraceae bacterium]
MGSRHPPALRGLFALLGALLFVQVLSPSSYSLEAFQIRAGLGPFDLGYTELVLPPVGKIFARTHLTPVKLSLTLEGVDVSRLKQLSASEPADRLTLERLRRSCLRLAVRFAGRVTALAAAGSGFGLLLLQEHRPRALLTAAGAGALASVAALLATAATYDLRAFSHPQYQGALKAAPWVVEAVGSTLARASGLSQQLGTLASNIYQLFGSIDRLGPLGRPQRDITIMLLADIHNNPLALSFVRQVAAVFQVDLAVDAGDLTDFGTPLEAELLRDLGRLGVPYLVALGNHDSQAVVEALSSLPGVTVLSGRVVEAAGVPVLGVADPAAGPRPTPGLAAGLEEARDQTRRALDAAQPEPFLFVAHRPPLYDPARGRVPVIVTGHTHEPLIRQAGSSLIINPGTAGAAGLRGLQSRREVPYSLVLLYVSRGPEGLQPVAADTIRLFNLRTGFTLERVLLRPGAPAAPPADGGKAQPE